MTDDPRTRWNDRWADRGAVTEPAPFVVAASRFFPGSGRALDVASGPGRHGLWLAALGYETTLVDISDVALQIADREAARRAIRITTLEHDLETDGIPPGAWDVIIIHYFLDHSVLKSVPDALKPGGVVVFCQPTEGDHGMRDRFVLRNGEIAEIAAGWGLEILLLEEGTSRDGTPEGRVVARRAP